MHPTAFPNADGKPKYINRTSRLMSDYEVTLVNDNSELLPFFLLHNSILGIWLTDGSVCGFRRRPFASIDLYICDKGRNSM